MIRGSKKPGEHNINHKDIGSARKNTNSPRFKLSIGLTERRHPSLMFAVHIKFSNKMRNARKKKKLSENIKYRVEKNEIYQKYTCNLFITGVLFYSERQ